MKESHLILRFVFTTFLFQTALFSGCDFGEPKTQETMSSAPKSTGDSFYQLEVVENAAMKGQVDRYRFKLLKPVLLKDFLASEIVESILGTGASLKMDLLPHAESAEIADTLDIMVVKVDVDEFTFRDEITFFVSYPSLAN